MPVKTFLNTSIVVIVILLSNLLVNSQEIDEDKMQNVMYQTLLKYRYCEIIRCDSKDSIPHQIFYKKNWYNEKAKSLLTELLHNDYTDSQSIGFAKSAVINSVNNEIKSLSRLKMEASNLSQKQLKLLNVRFDSLNRLMDGDFDSSPLFKKYVTNKINELKSLKINNDLIKLAGFLDDKRFVKALKNAVGDSIHYDQVMVKLALARLKVEPFQSEMLNLFLVDKDFLRKNKNKFYQLMDYYNDRRDALLYINNQESIRELSKFLEIKTAKPIKNTDLLEYPPYLIATADIIEVIKNKEFIDYIQSQFPDYHGYWESVLQEKHVNFIINWLSSNYGKYELN